MRNTIYTLLIVLLAVVNVQAQEEDKSTSEIESEVVVGAIGGTVDVSTLGGAVYTIPIQVPEGINGMQPNLSIVYNSQSGNGLLGYQWTLNGTSAITRTGATWYHDGYLHGVNMNQNIQNEEFHRDRFMIDGQRLMVLDNKEYGADHAEYRTEIDNMTKVVSYKCDTTNGPAYFVAWMSNGNIAYYGSKSSSRIGLQQRGDVCIWLLDSIIDRNGNYVAYHYGKGGAHYVLKDIVFTGNGELGMSPTYRVSFNYELRPDEETVFIGNNALHQTKFIKEIEVNGLYSDESMVLWKYVFSYSGGNGLNFYKRLDKIDFYCGSESYKSTSINWVGGESQYKQSEFTYDGDGSIGYKTIKYSGDFNGDGYTDIITVTTDGNNSNKTARVYLNYALDGHNRINFKQIGKFDLDENVTSIYAADYDGDGMDDFMFVNRERRQYWLQRDIVTLKIYLTRKYDNGELWFKEYDSPSSDYRLASQKRDAIIMGDFFGEGKASFLIEISDDNKEDYDKEQQIDSCDIRGDRSYYISYDSNADEFRETKFRSTLGASIYYPADYDGDGKTEILYAYKRVDDFYTRIVKLINIGNANDLDLEYSVLHCGNPINWTECYPGDFNGDGKTDALFHFERDGIEKQWCVYLFKQSEFLWDSFYCWDIGLNTNPSFHAPYFSLDSQVSTKYFVTVADFNGDGKADIMYPDLNGRTHICFGPMRRTGSETPYSYRQTLDTGPQQCFTNLDFCVGHFLGNECTQFMGYSYSPGKNYIRSISPISQRYEVHNISDGMQNVATFSYDYLMPSRPGEPANGFFTLNNNQVDLSKHIYARPVSIKAVRKLATYNSNASTPLCVTNYIYNNVLIHTKGHGILGFAKTTRDSYMGDEYLGRSVCTFSSSALGDKCMLVPYENLEYGYDNNLISRTKQTYSIFQSIHNGKLFVPICSCQLGWHYSFDGQHEFEKQTITYSTYQEYSPNGNYYDNVIHETDTWQCVNDAELNTLFSYIPLFYKYQTHSLKTYMEDMTSNWILGRVASNLTEVGQLVSGYKQDLTTYSYNSANPFLPEKVKHFPSGTDSPADQLATTTLFEYNDLGQLASKSISATNQELDTKFKTMYDYSSDYRFLVSETDEFDLSDYTTSYEYDPHYGYKTKTTAPNGLVTKYNQTPLGDSRNVKSADGTFVTTEIRWADRNDPYAPVRSAYYTESVNHNVDGSPFGEARTYYDAAGRELRSVTFGLEQQPIFVDTKYNAKGQVEKVSDPHFSWEPEANVKWTSFEYDRYGRTFKTSFPDSTNQTVDYDGLTVSTTVNPRQGSPWPSQTTSQTANVMGWTTNSIDANGTAVNYEYNPDGSLKYAQIGEDENTRVSMEYDDAGNRTLLIDPDFGKTSSIYNAYGQLVATENPRMTASFHYDELGRLIQRTEEGRDGEIDTTKWKYNNDSGKGLLEQITHKKGQQTVDELSYGYDRLKRLQSIKESVLGTTYSTNYTYNENTGRLETTTYPTGFVTKDVYSRSGHLVKICDANDKALWQTHEKNAYGQILAYELSNGSSGRYEYFDDTHRLKNQCVKTSQQILQDLSYGYDDFGNLAARTDNMRDLHESFTYDPLNRLESATLDGQQSGAYKYDDYGRMRFKAANGRMVFDASDDGCYASQKPHAIRQAKVTGEVLIDPHSVEYTMFDKVKTIQAPPGTVSFDYGHDHQRIRMTVVNGGITTVKTYVGSCEFVDGFGKTTGRTFISGPLGVFAVAEEVEGKTDLHFILKDHLGSWTTITDASGNVEEEHSYDVWGNFRDPYTWTGHSYDKPMFDRGFTGHEHLYGFDLINMNGRMYDPVMSSFLSVDNYVQSPENSQNFNRYAYCLNNPLKYTDPSGESILAISMVVGAVVCAYIGGTAANGWNYNPCSWAWDGKTWAGIGIGAVVGVGAGAAFAYAAPGLASTAFMSHFGTSGVMSSYTMAGFVTLGAGGYSAGFGGGMLYSKGDVHYSHLSGIQGFKVGATVGALAGQLAGDIASYEPPQEVDVTIQPENEWDGCYFQGSNEDFRQMMVESSKYFGVETKGYSTSRGYYFEPITGEVAYQVCPLSWDDYCDYAYGKNRKFRYNLDYNCMIEGDVPFFNGINFCYRYTQMYANRDGDLFIYPEGNLAAQVYSAFHVHPKNSFEDGSDLENIFWMGVNGVIFGWNGCKHYYYPPW